MDSNDSDGTLPTSNEDHSGSRYSKRVRKPIKIYVPEAGHQRKKKHDYEVNCKILKAKNLPVTAKIVRFQISANLGVSNIVRKFLHELGSEQFEYAFIYYCEKQQSNIYIEWKRLKISDQLVDGISYKIRLYKYKKMEKKEAKPLVKKIEAKTAEAVNIPPIQNAVNYSAAVFQTMQLINYYNYMNSINMMMNPGYFY